MHNLNWVFKIQDFGKHIHNVIDEKEDLKRLYEVLSQYSGTLAFIELYSIFNKSQIVFVERVIDRLRKIYALQNRDKNANSLAREIGVTARTIFDWWKQSSNQNTN